jgi:hypothetical protein
MDMYISHSLISELIVAQVYGFSVSRLFRAMNLPCKSNLGLSIGACEPCPACG